MLVFGGVYQGLLNGTPIFEWNKQQMYGVIVEGFAVNSNCIVWVGDTLRNQTPP